VALFCSCERYEVCPRGTPAGGIGCRWTNDCNWGDAKSDGKQYVMATNTRNDLLMVRSVCGVAMLR
jgi:hypothetical protein